MAAPASPFALRRGFAVWRTGRPGTRCRTHRLRASLRTGRAAGSWRLAARLHEQPAVVGEESRVAAAQRSRFDDDEGLGLVDSECVIQVPAALTCIVLYRNGRRRGFVRCGDIGCRYRVDSGRFRRCRRGLLAISGEMLTGPVSRLGRAGRTGALGFGRGFDACVRGRPRVRLRADDTLEAQQARRIGLDAEAAAQCFEALGVRLGKCRLARQKRREGRGNGQNAPYAPQHLPPDTVRRSGRIANCRRETRPVERACRRPAIITTRTASTTKQLAAFVFVVEVKQQADVAVHGLAPRGSLRSCGSDRM